MLRLLCFPPKTALIFLYCLLLDTHRYSATCRLAKEPSRLSSVARILAHELHPVASLMVQRVSPAPYTFISSLDCFISSRYALSEVQEYAAAAWSRHTKQANAVVVVRTYQRTRGLASYGATNSAFCGLGTCMRSLRACATEDVCWSRGRQVHHRVGVLCTARQTTLENTW